MKIIKGAERSEIHWTTRKLIEMYNEGSIDANIDIQRGYVWKQNDKKSALIRTLIIDRAVPPLYFNKIDEIYEVEDGKQRIMTIDKYLKEEFKLSGLPFISIVNDDGEAEEVDINGLKFSEIPEDFQNAIKEYSFCISFTDGADVDEVADTFFNLNSGQAPNAATINRVKAKSKDQLIRLSKHEIFKEALSETALNGHVNDDLVGKSHAILNNEEVSMNATWVRRYMKTAEITEKDEKLLNEIFDRIQHIHGMIEDKKIAKRIYTRTHMISIVPVIARSLDDGLSERQMMEWFVGFFCGKKSATLSSMYNSAAGSGSGKNSSVKIRLEELRNSYEKHFSLQESTLASA